MHTNIIQFMEAQSLLEKLTVTQLVKQLREFYGNEISVPYSQESANCPYFLLERDK
jgi:hypothetical protein